MTSRFRTWTVDGEIVQPSMSRRRSPTFWSSADRSWLEAKVVRSVGEEDGVGDYVESCRKVQ